MRAFDSCHWCVFIMSCFSSDIHAAAHSSQEPQKRINQTGKVPSCSPVAQCAFFFFFGAQVFEFQSKGSGFLLLFLIMCSESGSPGLYLAVFLLNNQYINDVIATLSWDYF